MSLFHRHRYAVVDVQHVTSVSKGGQYTLILSRCRCGKPDTETVEGRWDLAHFMPRKEQP